MSQPILSIQSSSSKGDLPEYWAVPNSDVSDGKPTTYFRGRKLEGKIVTLPEGYRGVVVGKTKATQDGKPGEKEEDDDEGQGHQDGSVEVEAEFNDVIVWGHEAVADSSTDPFLRSMEEWLHVSNKIHTFSKNGNAPS